MSRKIFFCVPAQVAAIIGNITVLLIFGAGAAAGWYALYALNNSAEYNSKPMRTKLFAGFLGALSSIVFAVSSFGLFAVVSKKRKAIRSLLWSTWTTFFVACPAVAMFALLVWMENAWGAKNCTFGSDGKASNCQVPPLWAKIVASAVAAYGLMNQLYMTVILRVLYEQVQYRPLETADWDPGFNSATLPHYRDSRESHPDEVSLHNPHPE